MKSSALLLAAIIALVATIAIAQTESESEADPLKERLGVRVGYSRTSNDLTDNFGGGLNLALHFVQRIRKPLCLDFTLGAIYLGSTGTEITRDFFGTDFDDVTMRILVLTVAPMIEFPVGERASFYFSAGAGVYAVTLILQQSIDEFDLTDNHLGVNLNAGLTRRIFTNWFLDANFHIHKFWTADELDRGNPDWVWIYSRGDSDPLFWAATLGVALRLF